MLAVVRVVVVFLVLHSLFSLCQTF